MISKKWKKKFENKIIDRLIFLYFNIRNFEISKYRSFYISSFEILTPTPISLVVDRTKAYDDWKYEAIFLISIRRVQKKIFRLDKLNDAEFSVF